jgi:hypothetical protein
VAALGETWQIMGCEENGEEREMREAKVDGKVDEEDGEEDDEIHRPPATGMRCQRRACAAGGGGQRSSHEERRVGRSWLWMGIFSTPVDWRGLE